jgi:LuxR family maltose regulon positive regulatory protein
MADIFRESNDLAAARQHILKSQELGEYSGLEQNRYRSRLARARIAESAGDLDGALDLLDEAERQHISDFLPNLRPVGALKATLWVRQGKLLEAQAWARERGLSADGDLKYLREFEHVTLARVLLATADRADGSKRSALQLLERLLGAAEDGQRTGSVIQLLVLLAVARHMRRDASAAFDLLARALTLAEPEGYVRVFLDEGPAMLALLEAAARQGIAPAYVRQLLAAFGQAEGGSPSTQDLIEPLSERELDVLRLLGSDLGGPEIAGELSVSVNTLRTHTKNIYAKLGVNSRREAVSRAAELGLLSGARAH